MAWILGTINETCCWITTLSNPVIATLINAQNIIPIKIDIGFTIYSTLLDCRRELRFLTNIGLNSDSDLTPTVSMYNSL